MEKRIREYIKGLTDGIEFFEHIGVPAVEQEHSIRLVLGSVKHGDSCKCEFTLPIKSYEDRDGYSRVTLADLNNELTVEMVVDGDNGWVIVYHEAEYWVSSTKEANQGCVPANYLAVVGYEEVAAGCCVGDCEHTEQAEVVLFEHIKQGGNL